MNGYTRLIILGIGLVLTLCVLIYSGSVSLLADGDHLVGPLQTCGFPAPVICYLAANSGRVFHPYYLTISGLALIAASTFTAGLCVGTIHSHRPGHQDTVNRKEHGRE